MDFTNLIGLPLDEVKHILEQKSIEYIVTESSNLQKEFDTLLVVNVNHIAQNKVEIITDKFLLYI